MENQDAGGNEGMAAELDCERRNRHYNLQPTNDSRRSLIKLWMPTDGPRHRSLEIV
jgi:hypothetical protein